MELDSDKLDRICADIKTHQEHSDIVYLHYFNSLIAISTAIIGSTAFLTLRFIDSNSNIRYMMVIIIASFFGLYTCNIYNHYLQNEKQSQKYLIEVYDDICAKHPDSIHLRPIPFGEHKRNWEKRGWSRLPREVSYVYYAILAISISYVIIKYIIALCK